MGGNEPSTPVRPLGNRSTRVGWSSTTWLPRYYKGPPRKMDEGFRVDGTMLAQGFLGNNVGNSSGVFCMKLVLVEITGAFMWP